MDRKTITQEFMILSTNEKGKLPLTKGIETKAGIVIAGIMDLLLANSIKIEKKEVEVVDKLPGELNFLNSLYEYLEKKRHSVTKIVEDYSMSFTDAKLNQLIEEVGKSLVDIDAVKEEKGGLLGNKSLFIPKKEGKEALINEFEKGILQEEALSVHNAVLASLLKETKNLNQYFSKEEMGILQKKLKTMEDNSNSKLIKEMIGYIEEVMAAMIAAAVAVN